MKGFDLIGVVLAFTAAAILVMNTNAQRRIGVALAQAETSDSISRVIAVQRDSARAAIVEGLARDSAKAAQYSTDSLRWASERDAARLRADRAATSTTALTSELRATLTDSVQVALVDSLGVEHRRALVALTDEIQGLHEERASLWGQRATLQEIVAGHEAKDVLDAAQIAEQAVEIAALRTVVTPPLLDRILGTLVDPKLVAGLGVGLVAGLSIGGA